MRFMLIFLLLFAIPAFAAEGPVTPPQGEVTAIITGDFKNLKHTGSGRIDKIIDHQTILLNDGKIVRLLGLHWPFSGPDVHAHDYASLAIDRLKKRLPTGTEVMLYQSRKKEDRINRMGHQQAHVVIKKTGEWINGDLVREGTAFALTDATHPEMADQLYAFEGQARADNKPIWAGNDGVLYAEHAEAQNNPFFAAIGTGNTFRVVEGTVARSATSQNHLYLNFGKDRNKDFTVRITPAIRKELSRRGIDPMALTGAKLRVRGWLRAWNGPFMELDTPERLEILSQPTTGQNLIGGPENAKNQ
jgi:micrococcal nuclease